MKKALSVLIIIILCMTSVSAQSEEFENTLNNIEAAANKLNELIDKYKKAELDVIKTEDVTIVDEEGNGVSCELEVYYSDYQVTAITTGGDGKAYGNINHGKQWPGDVISFRITECPCEIINAEHETTFPGFDEHINRLKELFTDEVSDWTQEKAGEYAEDAVEKVFEKVGAGNLAGPFLAGFGVGADLGAPIGEFITKKINEILESVRKIRQMEHELGQIVPRGLGRLRPRIGHNVPLIGGLIESFRTDPVIKNKWDITVKCTEGPAPQADISTGWVDYDEYRPKPEITKFPETPQETGERTSQEQRDREEKQREEQERRERERREREEQEKRERERREREEQLRRQAAQIAQQCPPCDPIRQQIAETQNMMNDIENQLPDAQSSVEDARAELNDANRRLRNAQNALNRFDNPQDWVEDPETGRRVTTTDIRVQRQAMQDNWNEYMSGEQSAQETMENWENFDQADLEKAKQKARQDLQQEIQQAQQDVQQKQQNLNQAEQALSSLQQRLENLEKLLEELQQKLAECLELCKKYAMQIAQGMYRTYDDLVRADRPIPPPRQVRPPETAMIPDRGLPVEPETRMPTTETLCFKYEESIKQFTGGKISVADYEGMSDTMKEEFVSPAQKKAIEQLKERCDRERGTGASMPQQESVIGTYPARGQQVIQPKSCAEICAAREMTPKRPDWSAFILNTLNSEGKCKASARISYGQTVRINSCMCYASGQPSIQISQEQLYCRNTICGDVACDSSATCSCGENCIATVECRWGGWQQLGDMYQAKAGAVTST